MATGLGFLAAGFSRGGAVMAAAARDRAGARRRCCGPPRPDGGGGGGGDGSGTSGAATSPRAHPDAQPGLAGARGSPGCQDGRRSCGWAPGAASSGRRGPARCRVRGSMSSHTPPICSPLLGEQCGLAAVPDDHEQSGTVVVGTGARFRRTGTAPTRATVTGNRPYPPAADDRRQRESSREVTGGNGRERA